jgi:hypothetical protein
MSRKEAQNRKGVKRNAHSTLLAGKIGQSYTPTRSVPMRVAAHPWSGIGPGPFNFFAFVFSFFFLFSFSVFCFIFLFLSVYFFFCSN